MNKQLAEALVREGLVTDEQVRAAHDIWDLAKRGFVDEATLADHVARFFDVEIVDLDTYGTPQTVFAMLPAEMARSHSVVPVAIIGANLVLATGDPGDLTVQDSVKFLTGYTVQPVVARPSSIAALIARVYDATRVPVDIMSAAFDKDIAAALAAVQGGQLRLDVWLHGGAIDTFVHTLLEHAMRTGAHSLRFSPRGEDAVMTRRSASGIDERAFPSRCSARSAHASLRSAIRSSSTRPGGAPACFGWAPQPRCWQSCSECGPDHLGPRCGSSSRTRARRQRSWVRPASSLIGSCTAWATVCASSRRVNS